MKKFLLGFVTLLFISFTSLSQNITVKGKPYAGQLTWKDFMGKPDAGSPFNANTGFKFNTRLKSISFKADKAVLNDFEIDLELDTKLTWVKKGKETDYLLKHEQGHFDIAILLSRGILKQVSESHFTKTNFQTGINKIVNTVAEKYRKMGIDYDKETDHSANTTAQQKWDFFLEEALRKSEVK
jgi:predicted secreted Zn-dependent protease